MHIFWVNDTIEMDTCYEIESVLTFEVSPFLFFSITFLCLCHLFHSFMVSTSQKTRPAVLYYSYVISFIDGIVYIYIKMQTSRLSSL